MGGEYMPLWAAAILLIVCVVGMALLARQYGKSKKGHWAALAVVMLLLALALFLYAASTLILVSVVR